MTADWHKYRDLESPWGVKPEYLATAMNVPVYWEVKREGSCISVDFLDDKNPLMSIHTRNQVAEEGVQCEVKALLKPLEASLREMLGTKYIAYLELCRKGKSPAQFEELKEPVMVLFDIFDTEKGDYVSPGERYTMAAVAHIPYIDNTLVSTAVTFEDYNIQIEAMIERAKAEGHEGYVAKWMNNGMAFAVKCKVEHRYPKTAKEKKIKEVDSFIPLELSEVTGAIDKARNELGLDAFRDKSKAMPLIAKLVKEEEVKHSKKNVFNIYIKYCEYLQGCG